MSSEGETKSTNAHFLQQPQLRMEHKAVPLGRIVEPEEIAAMIHFLASNDCGFVNGQAIAVGGGFTAGMNEMGDMYE